MSASSRELAVCLSPLGAPFVWAGKNEWTLMPCAEPLSHISMSPCGGRIAAVTAGGELRLWKGFGWAPVQCSKLLSSVSITSDFIAVVSVEGYLLGLSLEDT